MKKIIGIGNALTDILIQIDDDTILKQLNLQKGSMQLIDAQKMGEILHHLQKFSAAMVTGGSASNAINGIAKLGGCAGFLGKTGNDNVGQFFENDMVANGVSTHLLRSEIPSGRCHVMISPDSERTMATFLGAAANMRPEDIHPEIFMNYDIFHVEGYLVQNQELIHKAVAMAAEMGLIVSIDLASFNVVEANLEFLHKIVKQYVNIVFANEEEAFAFTHQPPESAVELIAQMADIAIVKVGKDGSFIKSGKQRLKVQSVEANAIDTTGAGDLYAAGFLFGFANDYELDVCGKIGALISAKIVEKIGAKLDENTWKEIKERLNSC
ncbi:MAG: adenosine kinase [Prevotellaceae bacterium]|jgi:sugar/nucleoside kinase (ribokinase family)|nr:adenosine kinase [Prevotellaceae bacterium]